MIGTGWYMPDRISFGSVRDIVEAMYCRRTGSMLRFIVQISG